jgi:hypothetical protein
LVELLATLRDDKSLDGMNITRWRLRDANNEEFLELRRSIEVPLKAGGSTPWEYVDPNALLRRTVDKVPKFHALVAAAVQRHPPSLRHPWRLVVGFDEFTPG